MRFAAVVGVAFVVTGLAVAAGVCAAPLRDEPPTVAGAAEVRPATAVLMPNLALWPEQASGLTVVGWQQVVALRPRTRDADHAPVVLVSCAPAPAAARDADAGESCVTQIVSWLPRLRRGPILAAAPDKVVAVVGPEHLIQALSGPRDIPSELFPQGASRRTTDAGDASPLMQTAFEATRGWTTSVKGGVLTAWAAVAPRRRVQIVGRSLGGLSNLNPLVPEAATSPYTSLADATATEAWRPDNSAVEQAPGQAQETRDKVQPDFPLTFERVQLIAPAVGPLGAGPLCLRFLPPSLPPDCRVTVDTGAMSLTAPAGWEVLYLEERVWFDKRTADSSSAAPRDPGYWPWLPLARDENATESAPAREGALAVAARAAGVSATVLGWAGPSQEVASVLPVMRVVLENLRVLPSASADPFLSGDALAADPAAGGAPEEQMPADHTALADSPEWLALLAEQDLAIQLRNQAILEGGEIVDPDAEAAAEREEEAVKRRNEELLSTYPEGEDPSD